MIFIYLFFLKNVRVILEFQGLQVETDFQDSAVYQDHQAPWARQVKTVTRVNLANPARKDLKAVKGML